MSNFISPRTLKLSAIEDFLTCSVCLGQLTNTFTTPCGHRYCEKCIKEWVDRNRICPCCNKPIVVTNLIKDHQFDELIGCIEKEKALSEDKYFTDLIAAGLEGTPSVDDKGRVLSPVEAVLKKHLKESLVLHEKFFQELLRQAEEKRKQIETRFLELTEQLSTHPQNTDTTDLEVKKERLAAEKEDEFSAVQTDLEHTANCVAQAYDKYLREHIPALQILPVNADIVLLNKNVTLQNIQIRASDSIAEIKSKISSEMQTRGDKVISYGDDVQFFLFGPLSRRTPYEMEDMASNIVNKGCTHPDVTKLTPDTRPVMQLCMKPGSAIAVYGKVVYESNLPKQCFSTAFKQGGEGQVMDYFSCKQCAIKWICRPCMESCHKDHDVVTYIIGHQPTWGCCYCPRKKKCSLVPDD